MKCYLCEENISSIFLTVKNRQLFKCASCGLVFLDDKARKQKVKFDDKKFLKEYLQDENLFRRYFDEKLDLIEKHVRPGALLDIGCGVGTFIAQAKLRGWKILGVDSSKAAGQYSKKGGLEVKVGNIETSNLLGKRFDTITAFQLFEHLSDPKKVLKIINTCLKSGGILVITTPNGKSFLEKISGKHWFGYHNQEHLFVFDKKSLELLVRQAGFEIVLLSEQSGRILSPSWVLTRLTDYYYDHRSFVRKNMIMFRPFWKTLDFIKFREPRVDLLVVARKK